MDCCVYGDIRNEKNESHNLNNYFSTFEIQTPVNFNEEFLESSSPKLWCKKKPCKCVYTSTPVKNVPLKSSEQME